MQAVVVAGKRLLLFERVVGRNDHPDLAEVGLGCHVIGNDQVPDVNRIKGAKKQTGPHVCQFIPGAMPLFDLLHQTIQKPFDFFLIKKNLLLRRRVDEPTPVYPDEEELVFIRFKLVFYFTGAAR